RPRARCARADDPRAPGLTRPTRPLTPPTPPPPAGGPTMTSTVSPGRSALWTPDPALDAPARPGGGRAAPARRRRGTAPRGGPVRPGGAGDAQVRRGAALGIEDGRIAWPGPAAAAPSADEAVALGGRAVLPGWVDSRSHLVFDGDRAAEFEARMAGESYSAGGIGVTTDATRAA